MSETIVLTFKSEDEALAAMERLAGVGICDVALCPPAENTWLLSVHLSSEQDRAHLREFAYQSARLTDLWRSMMAQHVSMAVAAATVFHQIHRTTKAIFNRRDYDDALNIAARALSTFAPVYMMNGVTRERVEIRVNSATHRFARGATQLRSIRGEVFEPLFVQRSDMLRAISLIQRAGGPFKFAVVGADSQDAAVDQRAPQDGAED